MTDLQFITTANNLEGYHIIKHLGVVRGITVRSRSLLGTWGEEYSLYLEESFQFMLSFAKKREEAYQLLIHNNALLLLL